MVEKDPATWSMASLLIALAASLGGGFVRYREEMRLTKRFSFWGFVFDMLTSCFVGFLAFWVCRDVLVQPEALCACAAGFAGNLGANVFDIAKRALRDRIGLKGGSSNEQ